jgi:hypothetical protein
MELAFSHLRGVEARREPRNAARNLSRRIRFLFPTAARGPGEWENIMRSIITITAAIAFMSCVGATAASAAPGDTYKARKAACQDRAKGMNFGVHLIKKNRWVKDCIAGKHPA